MEQFSPRGIPKSTATARGHLSGLGYGRGRDSHHDAFTLSNSPQSIPGDLDLTTLQSRGTVSMPASPVQSSATISQNVVSQTFWTQTPQSAQTFTPVLNHPPVLETPQTSSYSSAWYDNTSGLYSEDRHMSVEDYDDYEGSQAQPPTKKKRAQVRIACTHCQKACKKCSNTRPCERCRKYGFEDCVDSQRKPRKSGVKRGPYKRRNSIKAQDGPYFSPSEESPSQGSTGLDTFTQTLPLPTERPVSPPRHYPPGPKTTAFDGAFASALEGPRWQNGRRLDRKAEDQAIMYPPTPPLPFPVSLAGKGDPFSRAVSPIHGDLDHAMQEMKMDQMNTYNRMSALHQSLGMVQDESSQGFSSATSSFGPTNGYYSVSAPSSPRLPHTASPAPNGEHLSERQRASSTEPMTSAQQQALYQLTPDSSNDKLHSPGMVSLTKIRKPSLRTLMSHGGSLANSREISPVQDSPTLFNQPMSLEDDPMMGSNPLPPLLVRPNNPQKATGEDEEGRRSTGVAQHNNFVELMGLQPVTLSA